MTTSPWIQLPLGLTFTSLIVISFFGNVLVCVAVYTNSKLHKRENFYFVSLAGADLLLSLLVMPFGAVNVLADEWLFGEYCKYWMCIDILCSTTSILHLAAISYDRLEQIRDPLRYVERMSVRKILAIIGAVWTLSGVVAFTPLAFDTNFHRALVARRYDWVGMDKNTSSIVEHRNGSSSIADGPRIVYQCDFQLDPLYAVLSSMASFYIPCLLMAFTYGSLYLKARQHSRAIRRQKEEVCIPLLFKPLTPISAPTSRLGSHSSGGGSGGGTGRRPGATPRPSADQQPRASRTLSRAKSFRRRIEGDYKARVTVGVIVGAFLISWAPFFISNLVQPYCHCLPSWLFITLTWMGYANSAQNPLIYSIFNRNFRTAFRRILLCKGGRKYAASTAPWIQPDEGELEKRRMTVCDM